MGSRVRTLVLLAVLALIGGSAAGAQSAVESHAVSSVSGSGAVSSKAVCPPVPVGQMRCLALVVTTATGKPRVSRTAPFGYGPVQFQTAYGVTAAAASSTNAVIAIVDAYDDPTAKSDLDTYSQQYGLPVLPTCSGSSNAGCFRKVNQSGGSSLPSPDAGWAEEISLDLQTAHAVCPHCGLLLVEANSNYGSDLYIAEDYAAAHANVVSNSWGGPEYAGETSDDSYFDHPGVAVTFSAGDGGYGVLYPAASRYVTAVGGTTLTLNGNNTRKSETVWSGTGSGCSALEPKPSWQTDSGCSTRTVVDVAADADPSTGAAVYDSYGDSGWLQFGGTSLASPLIASLYALAGGGGTYPSSFPYAKPGSLFDVTSGSNGSCSPAYLCTARSGYDGPSGLGTPIGTSAFAPGGGGSGGPTIASFSPASGPVGTAVTITGSGLTGTTGVTFNGAAASVYAVVSSTAVTATVPAGATTGPIRLTTPAGSATSASAFTVTTPTAPPPTIKKVSPAKGKPGTRVKIKGTDFTGATAVAFNGTPARSYTVVSAQMITAVVAAGTTSGPVTVTTPGGTATSTKIFKVKTRK